MDLPTYKHETQKYLDGYKFVTGCDEVGIGPLAGPVVAATVILNFDSITGHRSKNKWWARVRDSKTTDEKEREELILFIKDNCIDFGVGVVSHETIDEINIREASFLAMEKSFASMKIFPDFLFLDGINNLPKLHCAQQAIIGGDAKILSISAASIVAKVARDRIMNELSEIYPQYGFAKHKGYGTKFHREALWKFGVTPVHRLTFGYVQQCLEKFQSAKHFEQMVKTPAFAGMGNTL